MRKLVSAIESGCRAWITFTVVAETCFAETSSFPRPDFPTPDGPVYAVLETNGVLYVGGAVTPPASQPRGYLAAWDSRTGAVLDWNPDVKIAVTAIAVSGDTVYVGGVPLGETDSVLDAFDRKTAARPAGWQGYVYGISIGAVNPWVSVVTISDNTLYIGGSGIGFFGGGVVSFRPIIALDATSGQLLPWNPLKLGDTMFLHVSGIGVTSSAVYVAGDFQQFGGQARNYLAAFDRATASVLPWNPNANAVVSALVLSNETVYVGGSFTSIGGQSRNGLAAIEVATGNATAWDPSLTNLNCVKAIVIGSNAVYVAGAFLTIGGQSRTNLASIDQSTGNATTWNPSVTNHVNTLAVSGETVYVGGGFDYHLDTPYPYLGVFPPQGWSVLSEPLLANGTVSFRLLGEEAGSYIIQSGASFTNWTSIHTNSVVNGGFDFSEPATNNFPRYYRALAQP